MTQIGAPSFNSLGIKDNSGTNVPASPSANPSHLPLVFTLAQKGDYRPHYTRPGAEFLNRYGADTLKNHSKFFTHQTELIRTFAKNGNAMVVCRIPVPDSQPAMLRLSVEIITYLGKPRLVWHLGTSAYLDDAQQFAKGNVRGNYRPGTLISMGQPFGDSGQSSTIYPIMDILADSDGEFGNLIGIELTVSLRNQADVARAVLVGHLPITLVTKVRPSALSNGVIVTGAQGQPSISFNLFNEDGEGRDLNTIYQDSYGPIGSGLSGLGSIYVYRSNVAAVQNLVAASEVLDPTIPNGFYSRLAVQEESQSGLLDIFTGISPDGVTPYNGFEVDVSGTFGGQFIGESSTLYLDGGSDGLRMLNSRTYDRLHASEVFDQGVKELLLGFTRNSDGLMDSLRFPINTLWDTGFSPATKDAFLVPYAARKDIIPFFTPFVVADYVAVEDVVEGPAPFAVTITQVIVDGLLEIHGTLSRPLLLGESEELGLAIGDSADVGTIGSNGSWSDNTVIPTGTTWVYGPVPLPPAGTYFARASAQTYANLEDQVGVIYDSNVVSYVISSELPPEPSTLLVSPGHVLMDDVLSTSISATITMFPYPGEPS